MINKKYYQKLKTRFNKNPKLNIQKKKRIDKSSCI